MCVCYYEVKSEDDSEKGVAEASDLYLTREIKYWQNSM